MKSLLTTKLKMHACMLAVAVVVLVGTGSVAWAQVGASGIIAGCVGPSGLIRGVDETTGSCRSGDAAIFWYTKDGADAAFGLAGAVTAVTASAPLTSSGGTTPDIALPNVIINPDNTAIGTSALFSNTTGSNNTASGVSALFNNTTGFQNTASGASALGSNTTGSRNTASGGSALFGNTTGSRNTASGVGALFNNTIGFQNTASGDSALSSNTTGSSNTASGAGALFNNTTGSNNTASGVSALVSNTTGFQNTASGDSTLVSNTTGSNNTAIGFLANVSAGDLTNATAIGAGARVDASDKIRLGNTSVTVIEGQVPFTFSSDATRKENFQPVDGEGVLQKIRGLTLMSWNFIGHDPKQLRHYGPTAQEFFAAFGSDGIGTVGTPTTINSGDMAGILMIAVRALEKRTSAQHAAIETLRAENAALQSRLEALETAVRAREALAQR